MEETFLYVDVVLHALLLTSSKGSLYAVHKFTTINSSIFWSGGTPLRINVTARGRQVPSNQSDAYLPSRVRKHRSLRTLRPYEGLEDALTFANAIYLGGTLAGSRARAIMQTPDYDPCEFFQVSFILSLRSVGN